MLPWSFAVARKWAVIECGPFAKLLVVNEAWPLDTATDFSSVAPSKNSIAPMSTAPIVESVTVAVNVTAVPKVTDVPGELAMTACVGAGLTVWLTELDVLPVKLVVQE